MNIRQEEENAVERIGSPPEFEDPAVEIWERSEIGGKNPEVKTSVGKQPQTTSPGVCSVLTKILPKEQKSRGGDGKKELLDKVQPH